MSQPQDGPYRQDHVREIDGLRAIAVLLVLWIHLPVEALGTTAGAIRATLRAGNLGVDLFFVLSGFLITRILLVEKARGVPVRYFMARRFFRIFPIYYLTIFALLPRLGGREALAALTYTSNYAQVFTPYHGPLEHTWSLAVEEHFYLLWPPVVAWLAPAVSRRVLLAVVVPLSLASLVWAVGFGPWKEHTEAMREFILRTSSVRFLSLAAGALLAFHEGAIRRSRRTAAAVIVIALVVAATLTPTGMRALGLVPLMEANPATEGNAHWFMTALYPLRFPCIGIACLTAAVGWSGSRSPLSRLLRLPPLGGIGRISYALYLYHYPIFELPGIYGVAPWNPSPERVTLVLALCVLLASLSYFAVERPMLRLGSRFRGAGERPAAAEPRSRARRASSVLLGATFIAVLAWTLRGGAEVAVTKGSDLLTLLGGVSAGASGDRVEYRRAVRPDLHGPIWTGVFFDRARGCLLVDGEYVERIERAAAEDEQADGFWAETFVEALARTVTAIAGDVERAREAGALAAARVPVGRGLPADAVLEASIGAAARVFGDVSFHLPTGWRLAPALRTTSPHAALAQSFRSGFEAARR